MFLVRAPAGAAVAETPAAPAFVLLTLDTTRADRLGAYGNSARLTPALDSLARRGATLERAYAVTPVTLPSHASIHTGRYPPSHGVRDNGIHALPDSATTLAEALRERGYRTAAFVSAAVLAKRFGLAQGFEVYDDDLAGGRPKEPRMVAERGADVTVSAALRWLDRPEARSPVFLWVHLFDPHAPYAPPAPWAQRFAERPYDGEIAFLDAEVARLLRHPRLTGASRDGSLLVMAIADHGESLGEHDEASHGMLTYEATVRVPWIVAGRAVRAGLRVPEPVSQTDLFSTALELLEVGAPSDPSVDGLSLAGRLAGAVERTTGGTAGDAIDRGAGVHQRLLYCETLVPYYSYGWSRLRAVIAGRYKLIEAPAPELYDVVADPAETHDLYQREKDRAAELERGLGARFGGPETPPREARAAPDAASDAALRSLGYVGGRTPPGSVTESRPDPKRMMEVHQAIERGEANLYARDFDAALRELRGALDRDPDNLAALEDSALALAELGRFDGAQRALERALDRAPGSADLHLTMARLEGARDRWGDALKRTDAAVALAPDDPGVRAMRAEALDRLGRGQEAAAEIERGLAANPGDPLLEVRHAEVIDLPAGRLDEAEGRLVRAVARQPYLAAAWRALGALRERARQPDDAREAYQEGLRYQPRDGSLHRALGLLLVETDPAAARSHLQEAVDLSPSPPPEVLNALGDLRSATGDRAGATALWQGVVDRAASSPPDRHQRAIALRSLGRIAEAEAEWRQVVVADPDYAPAWQGLAALALDRRAWSDAASAAQRALDLEPGLATAWNTLAVATEETRGKKAALPLYQRAVREQPGYWPASFNLGLLLRDLGRAAEAAVAFEAVLGASSANAKAHYELGLLCAGPLADVGRARRHLETALRLDASSPRAPAARAALERLPAG